MTEWSEIISPKKKGKSFLLEIRSYKDLLFLLVRRDFVKEFKQTILGPLWFVIQPIFQTLILLFVFGKIGSMGPDGIPQTSFYLAGTVIWNLFSEIMVKTSESFRENANVFGKVYFPRIIAPLSVVLTNFLKFGVQFLLFVIVYVYELIVYNSFEFSWTIVLVPVYLILIAMSGLGVGLIISSLTTKYWDLRFLVKFGVQLMMFMSTVITPFYLLEDKPVWMQTAIISNPVSSYIEAFRFAFLGSNGGSIFIPGLIYSVAVSLVALVLGVLIFNRVEKNFMDTV